MTDTSIDDYLRTLSQEHQEIVAVLRDLMAESAPEAREVISSGSLAWRANRIVAIISRSKTHLTFAFSRGAEFTDGHGLLEGVGKTTRHVKIRRREAVRPEALREYIKQALTLDRS